MGLTWNMKGIGYKGWHNIYTCMRNVTWLFEYVWYESVCNSLEFLGETSRSCFSG